MESAWEHSPLRAVLAFVDCEMTGCDAQRDRVCEVGVRRVRGGVLEVELARLVAPGVPVGASRAVHGIDDAALVTAPSLAEVWTEVAPLLEGAVIVGHAFAQDAAFLAAAAARGEITAAPSEWVDTLVLARRALNAPGYGLATLCEFLHLPAPAHRALADCRATEALLAVLCARLRPETMRNLAEVQAGARKAKMRGDVRAHLDLALAGDRRVRLCYRVRGRAPFEDVLRIERLDAQHVSGFLESQRARRILRGDRILWAEPA